MPTHIYTHAPPPLPILYFSEPAQSLGIGTGVEAQRDFWYTVALHPYPHTCTLHMCSRVRLAYMYIIVCGTDILSLSPLVASPERYEII